MSSDVSSRGSLATIAISLLALGTFAGCAGPHFDCDHNRHWKRTALDTTIGGEATFFEFDTPSSWDDKRRVRLSLRGTFTPRPATTGQVTVKKIVIMGDDDSGSPGENCDVLASIAWPKSKWESGWIDSDWNGSASYWVTVRHYYEVDDAGSIEHYFQDQRGEFAAITPSTSRHWASPPIVPGEAITSAAASGSFFSGLNSALYDVRIEYSQATNYYAQQIAIYAAALPLPPLPPGVTWPRPRDLVYSETAPADTSPSVLWERNGIVGSYNGSNDYTIWLRVYYSDDGDPMTPEYSTTNGNFNSIQTTGTSTSIIPH